MFVAFIALWAGWLLGGLGATSNQKRQNNKVFQEKRRIDDADWQRQSKEQDIYYKPSPHAIIPPNPNFYSDGSLKRDDITGRVYSKGQYYCKCDGTRADYSTAPSNTKRPPRN